MDKVLKVNWIYSIYPHSKRQQQKENHKEDNQKEDNHKEDNHKDNNLKEENQRDDDHNQDHPKTSQDCKRLPRVHMYHRLLRCQAVL